MNDLPEGVRMEIVSPSGSRLTLFNELHDSIKLDVVNSPYWKVEYQEGKTTTQCRAIKSFIEENKKTCAK